MNSPWDIAYELVGHIYTKEEIDEMTLAEINEIIFDQHEQKRTRNV